MDKYLVYLPLRYGGSNFSKERFEEALNYLKKTHDVDGWHVILYGC